MKFNIAAGKFALSLSNVIGIVSKKSAIPSLSYVKLTLNNNILELVTTDSEISIVETFNVNTQEDGQISIDANMLYDAVRKIRNETEISFATIKSRLNIVGNSVKFWIPFVDNNFFPDMRSDDIRSSTTLSIQDLKNLFEKTKCAIALENTRAHLVGVFLHTKNGKLCSATTDCNRLAYAISDAICTCNLEIIIPRKTIVELNRLSAKIKNKDIVLMFHGNETVTKVTFQLGNIKIITKLILGKFPEYQKVIPTRYEVLLNLNTKSIVEAVERISIIAADKNRAIKFNIHKDTLKVYMSNSDSGFAEEKIALDDLHLKEELEFAINFSYLLECLYSIDGRNVTIKVIDNKSPILIEDTANKSVGYVIMPMMG